MYNSYEDAILERQEIEHDECATCPHKGIGTCKNQCMEITEVNNAYIEWALRKTGGIEK